MRFYKEMTGRKRIATSEKIDVDKIYQSKNDFDIENAKEISKDEFIELNNDLTTGNASVKLNARGCYEGSEIRKALIKKYL